LEWKLEPFQGFQKERLMRTLFWGLYLVALIFSPQWAAAAGNTPSPSGTTIPTATRIVDSALNVWTLSDGEAYENGQLTPTSEVILLLCYGGIVYQENIHHDWWVWASADAAWAASSDPRVVSASSTTIPSATQIVDSELEVWTLSGGKAIENGHVTPSSEVIRLLYAKSVVYQENVHHDWWLWSHGAWEATSAPLTASASGTTIPSATQIVDTELNVWTVSGGKVYENHALTPSDEVILLLFFSGNVYQENIHHDWWVRSNGAWVATPSDPRVGRPFAYVGTADNTVAVIDTGTNRVVKTVALDFPPMSIAVTPDAKHVYVGGDKAGLGTELGRVSVIETSHDTVVTTIPVPTNPAGIVVSPDGTRVYVVCGVTDAIQVSVSVIDTATNVVVATIDTQDLNPMGIAISPDGKRLFLPAAGGLPPDGSLGVIDTATDAETYFFNPSWLGERFYSAAVTPDNTKLYANAMVDPPGIAQLLVFNPTTGALRAAIPDVMTYEPPSPEIFSPDSRHMYGVGLGGVAVLDTATNAATTAVANLPGAFGVAITPDGRHLYITDASTNSVAVADTSTYSISTVIDGLEGARPIAIVPAP
jgi:YVTN family beta-propeller protein